MSSHRSRIERVGRRLGAAIPADCPDCGGPKPGYNGYLWENEEGVHRWGYCKDCGLGLDEDGRAFTAFRHKGPGPLPERKVYGHETPIDAV